MQLGKRYGIAAVGILLSCFVIWTLAVLTVQNLGGLLSRMGGLLGEDTAVMLSGIFGQLRDAQLQMGVIPMCGIVAVYLLLFMQTRHRRLLLWLAPLFAASAYLGAVLFAYVNDVLFWDILRSLAEMAGRGLFDVL